ncbi:MAG: phosphatidylglycerophosphatase A [Pusillimonas sp.]|jgi:phosphatidylglycerophosphatase A|nr:phosphatidylglycerophosphatase A [Pusillimonas sp.]
MTQQSDQNSSGNVVNWSWVYAKPDRLLVMGFGSGLLRPAPGTWGTLLAWFLWFVAVSRLNDVGIALVLVASFAYGCWACQRVGKALGRPDDSRMVLDEIVAFWLVLWLVPAGFFTQLAAFLLFRFFDIVKPPPIGWFDARLKNGFGVMWDDIVAALYALLVLAVLIRFGVL